MSQSLAKVVVHIVYSTKHRQPWLHDPVLRSELYAYNATVLKQDVDSPAILINGVEDHIHVLCLLSRKFAIMDVIKESKTETFGIENGDVGALFRVAPLGLFDLARIADPGLRDVRSSRRSALG